MKRLVLLLTAAALMLMLAVGVSASLPFVADHAQLLTESEQADLEEQAVSLWQQCGVEAVILTVNTLNGKTPGDFADDYYDTQGYGENGLLLLLSMEERDWYISTTGSVTDKLRGGDIDRCMEGCLPCFSAGDYYEGFSLWLTDLPNYLKTEEKSSGVNLWISLIVGLAAAGMVLGIMCYCMNTRRRQYSAGVYMEENSFRLKGHLDLFLYSTVAKRAKPKNNSTSSGGRSRGGGGGKF